MSLTDIGIIAVLAVLIAVAVAVIIIRKRKGKGNCGGCCENCPYPCKTPHSK